MAEIELESVPQAEGETETTSIREEHVEPRSPVRVVARSEAVDSSGGSRSDKPPPYPGAGFLEEGQPPRAPSPNFTLPKMEINTSVIKWILIIGGAVAVVAALLVVVLVPISFADINYYEVSRFCIFLHSRRRQHALHSCNDACHIVWWARCAPGCGGPLRAED